VNRLLKVAPEVGLEPTTP